MATEFAPHKEWIKINEDHHIPNLSIVHCQVHGYYFSASTGFELSISFVVPAFLQSTRPSCTDITSIASHCLLVQHKCQILCPNVFLSLISSTFSLIFNVRLV